MKKSIGRERFRFYIWVGAGYLALWLFSDFNHFPGHEFSRRFVNNIWLICYLVVVNFILFEYTLPYFRLRWKRILITAFLIFAHFLLYSLGLYTWRSIGIQLHIYTAFKIHSSIESGITYHFPYSLMSVVFFGVVKHIYDYRKLKYAAQQLRIEKQDAELNYLKAQTNPHFLFNTLNNIYSLSRDKSDLAPESILRLSKILRFMLYETGGAYIALDEELKIIGDYIALEKLRYDDSLRVSFNYDVQNLKQPLPPLLLIPLVENAFKHGVSETREQPFVDIRLSAGREQLTFSVKNSVESFPEEGRVKENIGLSNLRRQLELLYTDYSLSVHQGASDFTVTLKINLSSHV